MTAGDRLRGVAAGLVAGFAGGLFGVGGGVLLVPVLTGVFGLTQHQAHGTSLAVLAATALPAVVVYALHGHVAWLTAAVVGVASLATAPLGARLASRLSGRALRRAFAVFLVLVAVRLLWRVPEDGPIPSVSGWVGVAFGLVVGAAIGVLAGLMGVGGGILAVPAFALGLGMPQHAAQGTSLAVILVTGPAGALAHARRGNFVGRVVPPLAIGAAIGAPLASWLAGGLRNDLLVRIFALFLLANAVHGWLRTRRPAAA